MGRPIRATIPHSLGKEEARRRLQSGMGDAQSRLTGGWLSMASLTTTWNGDQMDFIGGMMGAKITGRLQVTADSVLVEVDLPEMLAALADRILSPLTRETQKLLEKK